MFGRDFHFYSNISGIREADTQLLPLAFVPKEPHLFQATASLVFFVCLLPVYLNDSQGGPGITQRDAFLTITAVIE